MAGYFVCGFQVVFIGVHMPSYLKDNGLSPQVASYALALIGLFNVFGTYIAGTLGQRMPRRFILSFIYLARAVAISVFLLVPLSPLSVYIFSAVMGTLWLSTVPPPTPPLPRFWVQHLSMLGGFVFFSHQLGSFMGVWLGGYLYDATGSYDIVWYIAIGLGVLAGLVNLPIKEAPSSGHSRKRREQRQFCRHGFIPTTPPKPPVAARAGLVCGHRRLPGRVCDVHGARLHGDGGRQGGRVLTSSISGL